LLALFPRNLSRNAFTDASSAHSIPSQGDVDVLHACALFIQRHAALILLTISPILQTRLNPVGEIPPHRHPIKDDTPVRPQADRPFTSHEGSTRNRLGDVEGAED
jgi:hypothetical protein